MVIKIKRYNPDFSLSISHELAYMRETPEGGYVAHGDYATLISELELVKADRDAQQKRADALAVERDAARNALASIYKTVTGEFPEWSNWHAYLDDIVEEVGAAVADIQAQGVEKFAELKLKQLASMHPDTHAFGATAESLRAQINELQAFAANLREAK